MKSFFFGVLTLSLAFVATGCNLMSDPKNPKLNPHPKQAYEITLTIRDAPGPFDSVMGDMQYDIANPICAPQDPISGARPTPDYRPDFVLNRVSDNVYKGVVYLDMVADENYYGLGVCHWKFTAAGVELKRNGVSFGTGIYRDAITSEKTVTEYMIKNLYYGSKFADQLVAGIASDEEVLNYRDKYFSTTLSSRVLGHDE